MTKAMKEKIPTIKPFVNPLKTAMIIIKRKATSITILVEN
jgi:hypothetical protein